MAERWLIRGRVQGVGFRWFVMRVAERVGLTGWVRNLPDGRVEVVASGGAGDLDTLDAELRRGPRLARVDDVERAEYQHDVSDSTTFDIR